VPVCKSIRPPRRGLCSGDLDRRITIKSRALAAPSSGVDFEENFAAGKTVWAALKTSKGRAMFYATNMDVAVTHVFYVRWYDTLTADLWVEYKSENYDIVEVENLDERDDWALLYCNVRGDSSDEVNFA